MPASLAAGGSAGKRPAWFYAAVAAGALAASLAGLALWRWQAPPPLDSQRPDIVQQHPTAPPQPKSDVAILDVDLSQPLVQIEADLDVLDAEIAELSRQAALLDARRLADELNNLLAQK